MRAQKLSYVHALTLIPFELIILKIFLGCRIALAMDYFYKNLALILCQRGLCTSVLNCAYFCLNPGSGRIHAIPHLVIKLSHHIGSS